MSLKDEIGFVEVVTDGRGGPLVSMAFVTMSGREWYVAIRGDYSKECQKNIIPFLQTPMIDMREAVSSLSKEIVYYYYPTLFMRDADAARNYFNLMTGVPDFRANIVLPMPPYPERSDPPNALAWARHTRDCYKEVHEKDMAMFALMKKDIDELAEKKEKQRRRKQRTDKIRRFFGK